MQTILGANGQIATELAKELNRKYTTAIRLVSRDPQKVNDSDQVFKANTGKFGIFSQFLAGVEWQWGIRKISVMVLAHLRLRYRFHVNTIFHSRFLLLA